MMGLRIGIVVDTHTEDNSVDLVMSDDYSRAVGVQVLVGSGSTRTGTIDLPKIPPKADKWDVTQRTEQDVIAIVGFVCNTPVVLGFMYPQVNQVTFKDKELRVFRHQSDVFSIIDGKGNVQVSHPSGTYLRIGEDIDEEDFTARNADGTSSRPWAIDRNLARSPGFAIHVATGREARAKIRITPDGDISVESVTRSISLKAAESINLEAPIISMNADVAIFQDAPVIDMTSNVTNIRASMVYVPTGNVTLPVGDLFVGPTSFKTHGHIGVSMGGSTSGPPFPFLP